MADLADVENALVATAAYALFPAQNGGYDAGLGYGASGGYGAAYTPNVMAGTAAGLSVQVARGWPLSDQLDAATAAGQAMVTVFAVGGSTRLTTRYPRQWRPASYGTPTLTATVTGATVTFGGLGGAGQVVGITMPASGAAQPVGYAVRLGAADTPATVAASFAALIQNATASGPVLTVPGSSVKVQVVADAVSIMELRRQEQVIRVTVWAPSPQSRDSLAAIIDPAFAQVRSTIYPDGSMSGEMLFRASYVDDVPEKAALWRRDFTYSVEYPTVARMFSPVMLFGVGNILIPNGGSLAFFGTQQPIASILVDEFGNVITDQAGFLLAQP